ncbi:ATP-grasp domain-containing protein [Salsuginibacillus kocurii]|uniref:ATP-grasp domain-containing protein n=1 Tax=Salsuginibacillus kocurii TaxID=427078 RepID=UPI000360E4FF|nr:ATP-grasp domain-containing protein [Salsuginibacillus kocurii]
MNILLTSGARRIDFVQFFQEALNTVGTEGKVIVADPDHNAPSLQVGDVNYVIPHQTDERYMDAIYEICKKERVNCLVPLNDWEVPTISDHKTKLEALGITVFAPDPEVVHNVRDKGMYHDLLGSFDVIAPHSYLTVKDAAYAIEIGEVEFPLIVKPRNGSASIGIEIVYSVDAMEFAFNQAVQTIQETPLSNATHKKPEENVIIQEVVEGEKFSLDIFNDLDGRFLASFSRKQLDMRGGDVDRCLTVHHPELMDIGRKIGENLGHIGYINTDVFYDGKTYYVIDINPRFGGGYSFSHKAGANVPAAIIAMALGRELKDEWFTTNAETELARYDEVISIDETKEKYAFAQKEG